MLTINVSFAIVSMYNAVSSGFEEWIHLFMQDSFGQKGETLKGQLCIETT